MWVLEGDLSHDDIQRLSWLEESLTNTRKKLYVLEAWELFVQDIHLGERIGAGSFGAVYAGTFRGDPVAIKTLKSNMRSHMRDEFFQEADIMKTFKHPNVLGLIGVVMRKSPNVIVMPLMDRNLQDVLRTEASVLGVSLTKAMEVAAGLEYIHHQSIIHCDLAARNILVTPSGQLKIADFGLARAADSEDCDISKRQFPIPVRWSAPEVWQDRMLSKKTDMWSFGIVFYEIMTAGAVPYVKWRNAQVKQEVTEGYRLPCPAECPQEFHDVMMKTWQQDPHLRPSCTEIMLELVKVKTQMADRLAEKRRLRVLDRQMSEEHSPSASRRDSKGGSVKSARTPSTLGPFSFFMQNMRMEQREGDDDDDGDGGGDGGNDGDAAKSAGALDAPDVGRTGSGVQRATTIVDKFQEALTETSWYHGRRSTKHIKEVTEPLLWRRGDFMVHETHIPGEYIISVMWRIPLHIKLVKDRRGIIECSEREYTSISSLVQHHVSTGEPIIYGSKRIELRTPVDRSDVDIGAGETDDEAVSVEEDQQDTRRDHHIFISYQVETEGALAREVYDALQSTEQLGTDLICFLDQYDLSQAPGVDPWLGGIRSAILSAKVFLVLVSENALSLTQTDGFDGTLILQLAMAVSLHKQGRIQLVPVFVGRQIQIEHPTKAGKFFTVFDSYDLFDAGCFPDKPISEDTQMTTREVLDYIFALRDNGFVIDPDEDDIQMLCNGIVEHCLITDPALVDGAPSASTETPAPPVMGPPGSESEEGACMTGTASGSSGYGGSGSSSAKHWAQTPGGGSGSDSVDAPLTDGDTTPHYLPDSKGTKMRLSKRRRGRWHSQSESQA